MNFLASINWNSFFIVLGVLSFICVVFTLLILIVNKYCHVEEDPKIDEVANNLSGANCGGCGYAGCRDFAKALVEKRASINDCSSTPKDMKAKIGEILGVEVLSAEPMIAVVKCKGSSKNTRREFSYIGLHTCSSRNAVMGGGKSCRHGCLGDGDCNLVCNFNAMGKENDVAKTDKDLCSACGVCIKACPKSLIKLIPKSAKVYVACSSPQKGKAVLDACSVGCIACGLCAKNCPQGAITMEDNLPVIDYSKCSGCKVCVQKCPRHSIVEL